MSKEEDWKELEEWQDKQNEIKQKNNVKYNIFNKILCLEREE